MPVAAVVAGKVSQFNFLNLIQTQAFILKACFSYNWLGLRIQDLIWTDLEALKFFDDCTNIDEESTKKAFVKDLFVIVSYLLLPKKPKYT